MKDKVITIYSEIMGLITFLNMECGKKKSRRLLEQVKSAVFSRFEQTLHSNYEDIFRELLPICCDFRYEKLSVMIRQVEMYRKDYLGHATKVRPFIVKFDQIEPVLKSAKGILCDCKGKLEVSCEVRYEKLGNAISQINECIINLREQYELWKQEVKSDKKSDWKSKLTIGIVVAIFSFMLTAVSKVYDEEIKSFFVQTKMVLTGQEDSKDNN